MKCEYDSKDCWLETNRRCKWNGLVGNIDEEKLIGRQGIQNFYITGWRWIKQKSKIRNNGNVFLLLFVENEPSR